MWYSNTNTMIHFIFEAKYIFLLFFSTVGSPDSAGEEHAGRCCGRPSCAGS